MATARQGAVAELAPLLDLRQEIELRGRAASGSESDPEPFLAWAEDPHGLGDRAWLRWVAWLGPIAVVALGIADLSGVIPAPLWGVPLLVNLLVGATAARRAYATIAEVVTEQRAIAAYAGQLAVLAAADFTDPALRHLQERLGTGERGAPAMLRRLGRLTGMAIPPSSVLYVPIQALTLWDVHVLFALERWKRDGGRDARRWLATLGEIEALAALAGLRRDNPDWTFPSIERQGDTYRAAQLGHPLLRDDTRVRNDVTIGPPGTFLLVTGSNMSGKSTLLRAVGVNAVLAQAGGPVCAAALALPPVALWTSARVQDSLERGVSFFLAELQRLKLIVDAATRAREQGGPRVMYLLDEILQGTNTAERSVAARRVIAYLVDQGAIGAVSTHDLALADDPRLAPIGRHRALHRHGRRGTGRPADVLRLPAAPGCGDHDQRPAPDAPHRAGAGRRTGLGSPWRGGTMDQELPEHARKNRIVWETWAAEYAEWAPRAWETDAPTWGIFQAPDAELRVFPESVAGLDVIELGCGTAYISAWLARRGAHPVGIDNSPAQLADRAPHAGAVRARVPSPSWERRGNGVSGCELRPGRQRIWRLDLV